MLTFFWLDADGAFYADAFYDGLLLQEGPAEFFESAVEVHWILPVL
jgi:hypothetical protein